MLITNGKLVTWGEDARIVPDGALLVEGGRIADMGSSKELLRKHSGADVLDAAGMLVMPGNICAHTHFYGALDRKSVV